MSRLTESKWLRIVVAAVAGIAIMLLLGLAFSSTLEDADTLGEVLGIVLGLAAASYFITGLVAGVWTRQTRSGIFAALMVLVINIIINIVRGSFHTSSEAIFIAVVFAVVLGSLGGFVGKLMRR